MTRKGKSGFCIWSKFCLLTLELVTQEHWICALSSTFMIWCLPCRLSDTSKKRKKEKKKLLKNTILSICKFYESIISALHMLHSHHKFSHFKWPGNFTEHIIFNCHLSCLKYTTFLNLWIMSLWKVYPNHQLPFDIKFRQLILWLVL
jgi:hypothetical protein